MKKDSKIYVAGHTGMVGSAIVRELRSEGYTNILTFSRRQYDLASQSSVIDLFSEHEPEYVKMFGLMSQVTY